MKILSLQIANYPIEGAKGMPTGGLNEIVNIIRTTIQIALLFAVILSLLMLIYAGWQRMTSAGDKQKLANARQRLTFVLVGLTLVFISFLIVGVLGAFFQIDNIFNIPTPSS